MKKFYIIFLLIARVFSETPFIKDNSLNFNPELELYRVPSYTTSFDEVNIGFTQLYTFPGVFTFHVKKNKLSLTTPFNVWYVKKYRIDYNNDGNWDTDWITEENRTFNINLTGPPPGQLNRYTEMKFELQWINVDNLNEKVNCVRSIPLEIFPEINKYISRHDAPDKMAQIPKEPVYNKKPILFVEGFDPINENEPAMYYDLIKDFYNQDLRPLNYTAFILNFNDAGKDMRENAEVVLKALEQISNECTEHKIIVAGLSMGGLISRYALAKAENDGIEHNVGLFVTFDSPHLGANINAALQAFIAGQDPSQSQYVKKMQNKLRSTAAKQLLLYNYYDPPQGGDHGPEFENFQDAMQNMNGNGLPKLCKNVSVCNGNQFASYGPGYLGTMLMDLELGNMFYFPLANPTQTDLGPGSLISDIESIMFGSILPGPLSILSDRDDYKFQIYYNPVFIPTWSALDIKNPQMDLNSYDLTNPLTESIFDDFIVQNNPVQHHIVTPETRTKVIEWLEEGTSEVVLTNIYNNSNIVNTSLKVFGVNDFINSGDQITLDNRTTYKIKTNHKKIEDQQIMHHNWDQKASEYFLYKYITTEPGKSLYDAEFKTYWPVEFADDEQNIKYIQIYDPWYINSNDIQPDDFVSLKEIAPDKIYEIFLYQGGADINNLVPPFYKIRTNVVKCENNNLFEFVEWIVEPSGSVSFENKFSSYTAMRFNEPNAKIKAVYSNQSINSIQNYTLTIPTNQILTISEGTEINFANGFTIDVQGELCIRGTPQNPVRLTGSGNNSDYDPFSQVDPRFPDDKLINIIGSKAKVTIENAKIENTYCGLWIEGSDADVHIKNSHFENCNVALLFNDISNTNVRIDSTVFKNNDAAVLMPEKYANDNQESNFFILHSLLTDNDYGILFTPLEYINSGIQSNLNFASINNTFYNSNEYGLMVRAPVSGRFGFLKFVAINNIFNTSLSNFNPWSTVNVDLIDFNNLVYGCSHGSLTDYLTGDPKFLDIQNHDFHLKSNSAAIDQGTEVYVNDFYPDIDEDSFLYFEFEDDPDRTENLDIGAFYYPQLNGSIATDMTFEGEMQIYGELVIEPEVTVIFKEGSRIKMAPESFVSVAGELRSEGTADNKIIFMPDDPDFSGPGYWFGIHATEGRYIHLNNTEICGAYSGVHAVNTPAIIKNSLLSNNETGIRLEHSNNSVIEACQINNNYNGMDLAYSNVTVKNNIIRDNDYGIWALRVNGNFNKNQITDNNEYGLCALNQSTFQMTIENHPNTDFEINNIFENNKYASVYIDRNSEPNLGIYFEMPELITGGFNVFNPVPAGMALISENEESIIKAEVNYWDGGYQFQGMFDIHPDAVEIESHKMKKPAGVITYTDSLLNLIYIADSLFITGDHNSAVNQYHHIIAAEPDSISARIALLHLVRNVHPDSLLIHLENIINNHPATQAALIALDHCVTLLANHKNHQEALDKSTDLINMYMSDSCYTEESAFALLEQSAIQRECASSANGTQKKSYITQSDLNHNKILTEYPKTEAARYLRSRLGLPEPSEKKGNLPSDFVLQDCYPNPFNSTVTIPFGLKNDSDVDVKIYDILGKLVWTCKRKNMSGGWHTIKWKGENRYGHNCASGIYLINFRAGQYRAEQKIILIK